MKSKTFVMMFVAIGCGLVAAYLTARLTARTAQTTVPVLVAKERIKAGDVIKEPDKLFVEMQYPAGSTPNAIATLESLKNKMVNKTVQPGQWLTTEDLTSNFGIELPKGFYAMSVKVSSDTAGNGFILPKSKVNVVATIRDNRGTGKARVVTVLQDVLVLAVDQTSIRPDDKIAVTQVSAALLAVKPSDSQRLTLAQSLAGGELRLVLRAHDDDAKVPLQPLDRLEWDNGQGDGFGSDDDKIAKFKLAVAKQDIQVGQTIDNPEQTFEVKELPFAPEKAVIIENLADLRGKVVKHTIFKDTVALTKNFEGKAMSASAEPKVSKHVMFIQNGGRAPVKHVFLNGILDTGDDKGTPPAKAADETPAPETPAGEKTGTSS